MHAVGIDIGGTKIAGALVDESGKLVKELRVPTPADDSEALTAAVADLIRVLSQDEQIDVLGRYSFGWSDTDVAGASAKRGLSEAVVRDISGQKDEPEWMTKFRLNALKRFEKKPMLAWFAENMPDIDFADIYYYLKPTKGETVSDWDMLPESMKNTYEKLGSEWLLKTMRFTRIWVETS